VRRILREGLDPSKLDWRRFVVAEDGAGQVVGIAQMKDLGGGVQEFGSLVVEPSVRGQGVGVALLHHLVDPAPRPVYLVCGGHNVTYYQRFGFRRLRPEQMPPPLLRKWRLANFFAHLFRVQVAVMGLNDS
jgi:N-acetylglutamate synthase-like GNAT family acetyltransferase